MFRQVLAWTLSFSLLAGQTVRAESRLPEALTRPIETRDLSLYFAKVNQMASQSASRLSFAGLSRKALQDKIARGQEAQRASPGAVAHLSQTLVLLWILGGVEAVRQNMKMRPLQAEKVGNLELLAGVGDHMINSFDLFASLGMASVTSMALKKPLDALNQLIGSKVTQPMLRGLLTSGASSFVTFVGFESGMKLWEQSILLLEPEEIPVAKSLRFWEIMGNHGTPEENRIFKKLLWNAYSILVWDDPKVTQAWIYNTWRHRILTGEFITMLTSMVTAGVVAGSLAPGAGTFIGFCFGFAGGLAGGVAAIFIPHSVKQSMTDGVRDHRFWIGENQLGRLNRTMVNSLWNPGFPEEYRARLLTEHLRGRQQVREGMLTVAFEQIYDAFSRRQEAETILDIIEVRGSQFSRGEELQSTLLALGYEVQKQRSIFELQMTYQQQKKDAEQRLRFWMTKVLDLQKSETLALGMFAYSEKSPLWAREQSLREIDRQAALHLAFREYFAGLLPDEISNLEVHLENSDELEKLQRAAQMLTNLYYIDGFKEQTLLQQSPNKN